MKVDKLNLERVFERTERLEAPLFQRPYVWTDEPNWVALLDAIQSVAERRLSGKTVHPHFLGTIVLDQLQTPLGKIHARQIIDGQQRLTTLQLAFAAARDLCARLNEARYAKAFEKLTINDVPLSDDADDAFKVWPTNADRADFRAVMKARAATAVRKLEHASRNDEWLIPNAYLFFADAFEDWLGTVGTGTFNKKLAALYAAMRDDLHLVVIDLEKEDDAQEIFETLNSLGTPLLPADLVKNFLFHRAEFDGADTEKLYDKYWKPFDEGRGYWRKEVRQGRLKRPRLDLFLSNFVTLQRREEVLIAQLFSAYREMVGDSNGDPAANHMERFASYAAVYESFDTFESDSKEELFFYRLKQLDTTTAYPLLLEILKRYGNGADRPARLQILGDLESFFVRRAICDLTTKSYNKLIVDLLKTLGEADDFSPAAVRSALLRPDSDLGRWPDDQEFSKAWTSLQFYKRLKNKTRMVLEALEVQMHHAKTEKVALPSDLTVEHLMPREWGKHWGLTHPEGTPEAEAEEEEREALMHTIGNLSLLTKALNPSVSNGPWSKKRDKILEHSALNLNRTLPTAWTEAAIKARTQQLLTVALKVWPKPAA